MNKNSGDDGHPYSCVFLPIGLAAVNNVIIYDEFSIFHDGFHNVFTFFLLSCRLTPCLKAGACAASFGQTKFHGNKKRMNPWMQRVHSRSL